MESYYPDREMADMHFMYGRANGNSRESRRLYAEHYPQRRIPYHKLFTKLHQRLSESGSFAPPASDCGRPRSVRIPDMEVRVLRRVEEDPEPVCEELQLLKVSVFPLSGDFSMNNHFTHTTSS
jgi:hypothetical protein